MQKCNTNRLLLTLLLLLFYCFNTYGQKYNLDDPIPVDSKVKIETLENGLTYYIRKNVKPEKRAEMRLFVNIGAVNEDDDQLGLAHFVEHMAFNGTKHFKENELIHYLQSIGMQMGPDINGFTSFDETVYLITVPTDSMEYFDKGLLIMEDWAHNLAFDTVEIDKERGIVVEEWRLGRGARQRMLDQYIPVLFKDSRYAERLPIGKKEIIENASYNTVKRFYNDWYRPELMAFAVIGDIDVAKTEMKIKEHFGRIESKDNARKKEIYEIPSHEETLVSVVSDKENQYTQVVLLIKHDLERQQTLKDLRRRLIADMLIGMLNQRFNELREQADPPIIYGGNYFGQFVSRNKAAYQSYAVVKEDGIDRGLKTIVEENERVKKFGFTASEFERYKKIILKNYETQFNEREKTESANYTWQYMDHFLNGSPIPGIEFMYDFANEIVPGIQLEEVNELAKELITDDNNVILVLGIDKEGVTLPTEEEVLNTVRGFDLSQLQPYEDMVVTANLMSELPEPGLISSEKKIESIEVKEMVLSNGARVILKPTDFKNDEILFEATSEGGQSLYPDKDMFSARFAANLISESGTGPYNKAEMRKFLAGKRVWVNPYIQDYFEGIRGGCSPEDMETMFQMLYLTFCQPKLDPNAVQSYINREKEAAKNRLSEPVTDFYYRRSLINANHHLRCSRMSIAEDFDKIDSQRSLEIYKERFGDASDFTFYFVGAFDEEQIKPLIEQYIATLPSHNGQEEMKDLGIRAPKDVPHEEFVYRGSDPKSFVSLYFEAPHEYSQDDGHLLWTFGNYLSIRYFDVLREEMSGVYGFNVYAGLNNYPWNHSTLGIIIPCSPDNVDELVDAAIEEIKDVQENGITDDYIEKLKNTQRKDYEKSIKENGSWLTNLVDIHRKNENYDRLVDRKRQIELITSENMKEVVKKYIDPENYVKVVLYPEDMSKKMK